RQNQAVAAKVALQMQDAKTVDEAEFGFLDRVQPATSRPQRRKIVTLGTEVDGDPLVPIGAIGGTPVLIRSDHAKSPS
ncbi:MAG: hypothetical protein ACREIR_03420, partial [Geminicoccaceae bacterium]